MPGMEPAITPHLPSEGDVRPENRATVPPGMTAPRSPSGPSAPIDVPLPVYLAIASMALRAEDLAPAATPPGERPFVGYDRERAIYARLRPELLARAEGRFVVLVGEELEGPLDTFDEALHHGWRRFGRGPLYIKQVLTEDPAFESVGEPSCRS